MNGLTEKFKTEFEHQTGVWDQYWKAVIWSYEMEEVAHSVKSKYIPWFYCAFLVSTFHMAAWLGFKS